ncbi:ABC transporter, partial [Spirillospora sp. NPDC048911]
MLRRSSSRSESGSLASVKPSAAIAISGLVKTFGRTRALDGLDLTVSTGEVHG